MKNQESQIRGIIKREGANSGVAGLKVKTSTKDAPLIEGIAIETETDADGKFACSFELCLMQHVRGSVEGGRVLNKNNPTIWVTIIGIRMKLN